MPKSTSPAVIPWLDLLRFIAAFLVMVSHSRTLVFLRYDELDADSQGFLTAIGFAVSRLGDEAVVLFFVLSGYLVGGRLWQRCREGSLDVRLYVIDRTSRIMLPLLFVLVATLFLRFWIEKEWFWEEFFHNILSLQGITLPELGYNHPIWSLPYEIWSYILGLGAAMLWTGRRALGGGILLVSTVLLTVYLVPWYTVIWVMGAVVYQWREQFKSPYILAAGVGITLYGVISLQFADGLMPESWLANSPLILGYYKSSMVLGMGMSLVVHQLAQMPPKSDFAKKLNSSGHWWAASSYSLYLSHFVVLEVMDWLVMDATSTITFDTVCALLWVLIICQLVAFMVYMLSEMHTSAVRRWLRRVFPAPKTKPVAASPVRPVASQ